MWTLTPRGLADGSACTVSRSCAMARLRAAAPRGFWGIATILYLVVVLLDRALVPAGSPYALLDLAPGAAAVWLSTHVRVPGWWRDRSLLGPVGTILLAGPVAHAAHGVPPAAALLHGPLTLAAAGTTVLAWKYLLRPRQRGAVANVGGILIAAACGAMAAMAAMPSVTGGEGDGPGLALAWFVRAVAGIVSPVLLGHALLAARNRILPLAQPTTVVPLIVAAILVGTSELVTDQRPYLFIPLVVWAASTLTVRGTAAYSLLVLVLAMRTAQAATGPFAVGSLVDRSLTANVFVLVVVGLAMTLSTAREERAVLLAQITASSREAIEESTLFATMIAATQDAVLTIDAGRRVTLANGAARALATQVGTTVEGLIAGDDGAATRWSTVLEDGTASATDLTITPPGPGGARVLALRAYPMRHLGRSGAVVFLHDVTAERRRTEGLRYFARTLAHDLRNPLAGIQVSSELAAYALDHGDTDEAAAMMTAAAASGDRAASLLRDVADYSLAGEGTLAAEPVSLDDLVAHIARQRLTDPAAEPVDLSIDADVLVQVDARQIARVLENLLGNAAKYRHPGEDARVDVVAFDRGDGRATVLIQDRGFGIPAGQERAVFEAFHRVPEHAVTHPGTGLGLAICRQVVERHGGAITAEPRPGGGTTFRFSLPLAAEVGPVGADGLLGAGVA